jgi:transglutaminase-like putative cysteine protease
MTDDVEKREKASSRLKKPQIREIRPAIARLEWSSWQWLMNIILLFLVLEIAVLSIEQARWITPQPSLSLVLFLSMLVVLVLWRVRLPGVVKHVLSLVIGLIVTFWQALVILTVPETASRLSHLLNVFQSWWQQSGGLLSGDDKVLFAVFITFLTWVIGYISTWFFLRKHNAWVAALLGMVVVLVNLSNLPGKYYFFFALYLFAAIFLIAVTRMTGKQPKAERSPNYSLRSLLYLGTALLCLTALAASISWIAPQARAPGFQNMIATRMPWRSDIQESKLNIFNAVPSKQAMSTTSTLKNLTFENTWNQGDEINFIVMADRPAYWRMSVYNTYSSQGWENSETSKTLLEQGVPWIDINKLSSPDIMTYEVTTDISTDVLLTTGDFVSSDTPVRVDVGAGEDVVAISTPRVLGPGERYVITSCISSAEESDLSRVRETYPEAIINTYLQLPPDFPADIRLLSESITANATTPYAKVMAIVDYLSKFTYSLEPQIPPEGADSVAYFLFTSKAGFCLHFASAMAVMLRSVDVPSRLVIGYLPGDPGEKVGQYILRDKHYHAWSQVYFPGSGWVDIEATPSGTESQVAIETPWVSSPAIESIPQWAEWLANPPYGLYGMANKNPADETPAKESERKGSLAFAEKLGYAMLVVFGSALFIGLLLGLRMVIRSASFRWLWRVDRGALAYRTYTNMCTLAAMLKLVPRPQQTPLEFAAELAATFPQEAEALDYIVQAYVENRFGRREGKLGLVEEAQILKARHVVYEAFLMRLGFLKKLLGKK